MKKYLLVFLLLLTVLIPFNINAKEAVEVTDIEIEEKTPGVEVISDVTYQGLKINFNVSFLNVEDFIRYKVTLKNNTDKDYEINSNTDGLNKSEFIEYFINFNDNTKIIKANSEKTFTITIMYVKEVSSTNFTNGVFVEDNSINLNLATDEKIVNPQTGQSTVLLFLIILFVLGIAFSIRFNKKETLTLLIIFLIAPLSVWAIETINIEVNSHVEVADPSIYNQFCLEMDGETTYYYYENNMTWEDYLDSRFNNEYFKYEFRYSRIIPSKYINSDLCNAITLSNGAGVLIDSPIISKDISCYKFELETECK